MAIPRLTWLGHAAVRITTADDHALLVDPWLRDNPACPQSERSPERLDAVFVTHGHTDHLGDTVTLCRQHDATLFANVEICAYAGARGVEQATGMNKGGAVQAPGGVRASMTDAVHSSGIEDEHSAIIDGGTAGGWVFEVPGFGAVYHAGDTMLFGDMEVIQELWQPRLGLLPIGGHFVMDPRQAALAAQRLGLETVVPIHYGTFPVLTGTPRELISALEGSNVEVRELKPGDHIALA